jgi:hypothetical protein
LSAADDDFPADTLTYELLSAPPDTKVDPVSGSLSWRAPLASANTTNLVRVRVTDNSPERLSDTKSFQIVVRPADPVSLRVIGPGVDGFALEAQGFVGPDYILQTSATLAGWTSLQTNTPTAMPLRLLDANPLSPARFYRVLLKP